MSIDSELVVVCHCKKHAQLYYAKGETLLNPISDEVMYVDVDPECPEATWDVIKTNSKSYVWGFSCPIYIGLLEPSTQVSYTLINILKNSWRVLKNGGKVIFGLPDKVDYDIAQLQRFFDLWVVSSELADNFLFNLGKINIFGTIIINKKLLIFTKVSVGGKRKRKTRRRKSTRKSKK